MIIAIGGNMRGMMIDMSVAGPPVLKRERLYEPSVEFIEIMDVNYAVKKGEPTRRADLVVPRKLGLIRHLAE